MGRFVLYKHVRKAQNFPGPEVQYFMDVRRSSHLLNLIVFLENTGVILVLFFFAFVPSSVCQDSSSQTAPQPTTVVNVDEVSLNLVVRNSKGKIVPDLKPEEISVTDGGVPVKISSLRLVSGDGGDHLVTLLFDRLDSAGGRNAQDIAGRILKMVPTEGFSLAVMKAQGRLMLYQDFTSDRQRVADGVMLSTDEDAPLGNKRAEDAEKGLITIAKKGTDERGAQVSAKERAMAQVVLVALQGSQRVSQELHTPPGLAGLLALARSERQLPGRKTIIYFSQGIQADTTSDERLQEIVGAANRSGVSIYAIDANALTAQADQALVAMTAMGGARAAAAQSGAPAAFNAGTRQPYAQQSPGLGSMVNNQLERYESADPNANKSPLAVLAESTGGAYVPAGDDVKKPLRRMIEDMTTYYEASYASPVENYDGQFRPITVKAARQGLKISARAGYFALPPDSGQAVRPFEAPLLKIFTEAQLPSDIAFHARVLRLGELSTGNENTVVIQVPMAAVETRNDSNTNLYSLRVSIVAQIRNKAGAVVEHFGEDVPRHGALSAKDAMPGITMQRHFTAEPGQYVLEAAVVDQNNGKTGAQRLEFEIPDAQGGPFLSDLAMVQRIDPVPQEADPSEPMRYGNGKVVPGLLDQVPKGIKELSLFFVVHPGANLTDAPKLEMEVLKSGESIARVPLTLTKTTGPVTIPYLTSIQSGRLPGGDYKVIERLTQGGKTAARELTFHIKDPETPIEAASAGTKESPGDDAEPVTGMQIPTGGPGGENPLITSLPKDAVPPPTSEQLQQMIDGARKRALAYNKNLPNFLCVEVTNRSVDASGNGKWKHRDSIAELLSYHDNSESRTTLEVNGKRSSLKRADINTSWPLSVGEFGAMLNLLFQPSSKTVFEWKEAASLGDGSGTVQVLSYEVAHQDATIVLSQGNEEAAVGFHGLVYLDPSTSGVRRITLEADGVPKSFAIHGAAMTVDYDFVAISGRDYLMPVHSTVVLVRAHRKTELNEIAFRNYRRFASRTKIKMLH